MSSKTLYILKNLARFTEDRRQWKLFAKSHDALIRSSAVRNIFNAEEDYLPFLEDESSEVRGSIALSTKSEDLLRILVRDKHHVVRAMALMNPYGTKEILEIGCKDTAMRNRESAELALSYRKSSDRYDLNLEFREIVDLEKRLINGGLLPSIREIVKNAIDPSYVIELPSKMSVDQQLALALNSKASLEQLKTIKGKIAMELRVYNPNWQET